MLNCNICNEDCFFTVSKQFYLDTILIFLPKIVD
uniref:Uncharacterized protein n=1 Tax=Arundo donax TaxID=35708 RepID=A0A0A8YQS2_ARUDO